MYRIHIYIDTSSSIDQSDYSICRNEYYLLLSMYIFSPQVILDPRVVGLRYARGWFVVDMVSSFPVDYVVLIFTSGQINNALLKASRALRVIRLVKLISLLKLLRISRLLRFMQRWEEVLSVTWMYTLCDCDLISLAVPLRLRGRKCVGNFTPCTVIL